MLQLGHFKNCILRNFTFYNFCWILDFQPFEEDWATPGLLNILNGIDIANLWPIYAAIRAYFKNCILWNFTLYNFCWILDFQPLEKDWATSGLLNILTWIDIANLWPIYAAIRAYFKNCILENFTFYNCCWILDFQPFEEDWTTSGLLNILNGIDIANLWPICAAIRAYFKNCILWNFTFHNFCWILDFQPLEKDWATSGLLNILNGIDITNPLPMAYLKIVFCEI